MKKLILFLSLVLSVSAFSQSSINTWQGYQINAKDGNVGALDSNHYIGIYNPNTFGWPDSISVAVYHEDTLACGLLVRPYNEYDHTAGTADEDTASVLTVDLVTQQEDAAGIITFPWFKIRTALGTLDWTGVSRIEMWLKVKPTGTTVAAAGKKATVRVRPYNTGSRTP